MLLPPDLIEGRVACGTYSTYPTYQTYSTYPTYPTIANFPA
jgi:hypothetical protein